MNVSTLQSRLTQAGKNPGPIDGEIGAKTYGALIEYAAGRPVPAGLAPGMAVEFPKAAINTPLRVSHFLAQALHETMGFKYLTELGGPTYCAKYDGRADLGNSKPGDGYRFRGRGIYQLTGRANYAAFGARAGLDLIADPDLAAVPANAVRLAALYWTDRKMNGPADRDDVEAVTRKINGGLNGIKDRKAYLAKIKAIWGIA